MKVQDQVPGGVSGGGPANKKKFPWMIVLGGCGCLTVLMVLVLGVGGYFMVGKVSDTFGELAEDYGITVEGDGGESSSKSSKSSKKSKSASRSSKSKGGKGSAEAGQKDALSPEKIRSYMSKTLTKSEIKDVNKSAAAWKKNKAFVEFEKNANEMKALDGKGKLSTVESMRAVRNATKTMASVNKLGEAFDAHVEKHGGYETHFSRILRISGIIAATDMIAKQHDIKDKHSDEAIKMVLKEQPEVAAEYKKGVKEAKAAAAKGEEVGMESYAAIMSGGPGAIAMARMPAASFKTWQSLSVAERKQAEEDLTSALGVSSFFGIGLQPMMLFQAALASEFEDIGGKKK